MKKLLPFLSILCCIMLFTLDVNAQAMPTPDATTLSLVSDASNSLLLSYMTKLGLFPYVPDNFPDLINSAFPATNQFTVNDLVVSPLSDDEQTLLENATIYNLDGDSFALDDVYSVYYNNGYFNGNFYMNSDGQILYSSSDGTNSYLNIGLGGSISSPTVWQSNLTDLSQEIISQGYFYNPDSVETTTNTYYMFVGENSASYGYPAYSLYIPNQYQVGKIVPYPDSSHGNYIYRWYCNDTNLYTYRVVRGYNIPNNRFSVTRGDYTYQNVHYTYLVQFTYVANYYNSSVSKTYEQFVAGNTSGNNTFVKVGTTYNASNFSNTNIESFKPVEDSDLEIEYIDEDEYYSYEDLDAYNHSVANTNLQPNPSYDYSLGITPENFPVKLPLTTTISPSSLPFPNTQNNPNGSLAGSPYLNYDAIPQPDAQTTLDSFTNFRIPFFENLFSRYPFSIPWDIKLFVERFSAEPLAPAWDFDWTISVGSRTYTQHFQGDLSDFDDLALIFRNLLLIGFIIGLMAFSYRNHF